MPSHKNSSLDPLPFAIVRHVKNDVFYRRHHYHIHDDSLNEDCSNSDLKDICQSNSMQTNAPFSTQCETPPHVSMEFLIAEVSQPILEADFVNRLSITPL